VDDVLMKFSTELTENYFVELETQFMSSSGHFLYQWPFTWKFTDYSFIDPEYSWNIY